MHFPVIRKSAPLCHVEWCERPALRSPLRRQGDWEVPFPDACLTRGHHYCTLCGAEVPGVDVGAGGPRGHGRHRSVSGVSHAGPGAPAGR